MHRVIQLSALLLAIASLAHVADAQLTAVRAELIGGTSVWKVERPVFETTDAATFQTERYGRDFTYAFHDLPPGPVRLKLGFCENSFTRPGQRVFDVLVNGEIVLEGFDILEHAARDEALILTVNAEVSADRPLQVRFVARTDNAKINLVRVYTADWVMETSPATERTTAYQPRQRSLPTSEDVWETQLGRLGSRVAINPRPQQGIWWQSPLGHAEYRVAYFDPGTVDFKQQPARYVFGVLVGDMSISMPFDDRLPHFSKIDQTETLTKLSYQCSSPELPVDVRFTWGAPFYPRDAMLSTAPYLTLQVDVTGNSERPQSGQVLIARSLPIGEPMTEFTEGSLTGLRRTPEVFEIPTDERWVVDDPSGIQLHPAAMDLGGPPVERTASLRVDRDGRTILPVLWEQPYGGLSWHFTVEPGETVSRRLAYVGWVDEPVQNVHGVAHRFKYHEFFDGPDAVARYAFDNWDAIEERCAFFERSIDDATLPASLKQLLAFATHSYLINTWWTISPEGRDFFTVWEGCCQLQSTVDVEYNIAPLYFHLWPDLLRMQLDQWVLHIVDGVLSHDIGVGLEVNEMAYWHPMEIEENTNFVLLLHHYWRHTGDADAVRRHYGSVRELLDWITSADLDGDGFPSKGLYNTIDQGSPAIQYAPDQVYLAVRSIAAYQAGAEMAGLVDDAHDAQRWLERASLTARTLDEHGWLDDHYVVALNQAEKAARQAPAPPQDDQFAEDIGEDGAAGPVQTMQGWDSYSIYTTNGLVYPMRSGMTISGLDLERLRIDIRNATARTMGEFGSPHTSHENNMWVSQNIWRDMAAAYLGLDWIDNADRYWNLQRYINTEKFGAFTDVYVYNRDSTSLDYYPRGVAAYGLVNALAGLQFDRVGGVLSLAPVRTPLRIPLTMFADWEAAQVPWLSVTGAPTAPQLRIEGDLPDGIELRLRPRGEPFAEGRVLTIER